MFNFKKIRQLRRMKEVTLKELESKCGIGAANINVIELGKKDGVTLRTVEKIIAPLGYELEMKPTQGTTETFTEETLV